MGEVTAVKYVMVKSGKRISQRSLHDICKVKKQTMVIQEDWYIIISSLKMPFCKTGNTVAVFLVISDNQSGQLFTVNVMLSFFIVYF